jgi:hypothetical protein
MFEFLQPADRPVIDGLEHCEVVYAKNQPQYNPLRVIRSNDSQRAVLSRWTLTPDQRRAVAEGADIFLELLTFGQPLSPIRIAVSDGPNPEVFEAGYSLTPSAPVRRHSSE